MGSTGNGPNLYNETEVVTKFEIMDGAPIKGENVPIRLFLEPYDLTPTFRTIHNKFSVRYYLNLVLVDEEERRYFKQQEITIFRRADKVRKNYQAACRTTTPHCCLTARPPPRPPPTPPPRKWKMMKKKRMRTVISDPACLSLG